MTSIYYINDLFSLLFFLWESNDLLSDVVNTALTVIQFKMMSICVPLSGKFWRLQLIALVNNLILSGCQLQIDHAYISFVAFYRS